MPLDQSIDHVLVIGSGPIVIGQACEFDYSGTQACRVLRAEGVRVTLVNSNPATIMTDPDTADATYLEPITPEVVEQVLADQAEAGHPVDALLATLGGQTALNTAVALAESGALRRHGVRLIGADVAAIARGEDRQRFKDVVRSVGGDVPASAVCRSMDAVRAAVAELGLPVVVRPSFTMGGLGSGMARTEAELARIAAAGLAASPVHEVLIEESVTGWKEIELELMHDGTDTIVLCTIENVDPMGVHTGDSVAVAPAQTVTADEYDAMAALGDKVIRAVGLAAGGCNIQFAIDPESGRMVVIEMNPRVSRSSALASKAIGLPIAKLAAKLALGYRLAELPDPLTGGTLAGYRPPAGHVAAKVPRFDFEKFPAADRELTTTMKSVGEVMAIGATVTEALGKALRSTETGDAGLFASGWPERYDAFAGAARSRPDAAADRLPRLLAALATPTDGRLHVVAEALALGAEAAQIARVSGFDPFFVAAVGTAVDVARDLHRAGADPAPDLLARGKRAGLSDEAIAALTGAAGAASVRQWREAAGIRPVFGVVAACDADLAAAGGDRTAYRFSSYGAVVAGESGEPGDRPAGGPVRQTVIILGSGPNRIGQGIEFDYSCVHASMALRAAGFEVALVNCNPETVSTDYDTADRLYFEPLTAEDVAAVVAAERARGPLAGVVVTLGGQTPLKLARVLAEAGVPLLGTGPDAIDLAEDRGAFGALLGDLGLDAPRHATAAGPDEARAAAADIGYPVLLRPSYVLGGRDMKIVYDEAGLDRYLAGPVAMDTAHPVLVDRFLEGAVEVDVDALCDGAEVFLGAIVEHIEEAGVHSGDSACVTPPLTLGAAQIGRIRRATELLALRGGVRGLINVQYALRGDTLFVIEANPRASRTVPLVAKATGIALAKAAARVMAGVTIADLRAEGMLPSDGDGASLLAERPDGPVAVKEAVLPFHRFVDETGGGVDTVLGPEMRSTGEVLGLDTAFGPAFAKSQLAAYGALPTAGTVFVSVADADKRGIVAPVRRLAGFGFTVLATEGTAALLRRHGIAAETVARHSDADRVSASVVDRIRAGTVDLVINTPRGHDEVRRDGYEIRTAAVAADIACITTIAGAVAVADAIAALRAGPLAVRPLQRVHAALRASVTEAPASRAPSQAAS